MATEVRATITSAAKAEFRGTLNCTAEAGLFICFPQLKAASFEGARLQPLRELAAAAGLNTEVPQWLKPP
jgi:hypothetical protein